MKRLSILILIAAGVLAGCEESVAPILDTGRPFTMWGYLDPTSASQQIRVFSVDGVLDQVSASPLAARVLVKDLPAGSDWELRDSLVTFPDGSHGHVFVSTTPIRFDHEYGIEATRPDGLVSRAHVRTPPGTSPAIQTVTHSRGFVRVDMSWGGAPQLLGVHLIYYVNYERPSDPEPLRMAVEIDSGTILGDSDSGWGIRIDPSFDFGTILEQEFLSVGRPGFSIALDSIDVRPFVGSSNWAPPGGNFSAELLVQPGTFSNVENGFGFVGGGYEDSFVIQLPDEAARDAGFTVR